jgi:small subunit ribosomal protein S6
MLILPAEADEAMVGTAVERITKAVSDSGGAVGNIDRWGRRRFAYEINDQHEGYYVVVRFSAEPSTQKELERVLNLADEVIRYKVLVVPTPSTKVRKTKSKEEAASPASA